ncbi:Vicilin-like seed storage protein [Quillaja saponaria]|uniref:Vicilin-like seed storage protein n=1 Tax=Quillaja saponaria TaxID=32244 RepID=A0AAD7QII0_QUISA|nr:Vicilin-like seed storage protein [Quillaja saponaria]
MGKRATLLILVLVMCYGVAMTLEFDEEKDWRRGREEREKGPEDWRRRREEKEETEEGSEEGSRVRGGREEREEPLEDRFLLQDSKRVFETDAGEMRVVRSPGGRNVDRPMHIGFITMEPKSLFIPQYLDSSLVIFIRRGEVKLGFIYKDSLAERRMKTGDVYHIPAGSAFYLVNTGEGQRLHIICSIDPSESIGVGVFQSFFIGGGTFPPSILSGFDSEILSSAFNVSIAEIRNIMSRQQAGPIVSVSDPLAPSLWSKFLELKEEDKLLPIRKMVGLQEQPDHEEERKQTTWSWKKVLNSILGKERKPDNKDTKGTGKSPDSYNLYDRSPDFKNAYGWSVALDETNYSPLERSGIGLYLVNLTAGSMMAPHVNPRATEYGIVLRGSGRIQIVSPNGTSAMNTELKEGDVFFVPKYFPFCQIASRTGPLEFFGFTTSARKNRPQFLVGASSVLQTMRGPELAAAFDVDEDELWSLIDAQREAIILPTADAAPPYKEEEEKGKGTKLPKVIKSFDNKMIMDFEF